MLVDSDGPRLRLMDLDFGLVSYFVELDRLWSELAFSSFYKVVDVHKSYLIDYRPNLIELVSH